jgi:hypothetical protein
MIQLAASLREIHCVEEALCKQEKLEEECRQRELKLEEGQADDSNAFCESERLEGVYILFVFVVRPLLQQTNHKWVSDWSYKEVPKNKVTNILMLKTLF